MSDDAALQALLRRLFEEGARAFPDLQLGFDAFASDARARSASGPAGLPFPARGADLYLAAACTARVRGAIEAFERAHLDQTRDYVARLRPTPAFVNEVRQEVRDKLFVGKGSGPPKIAEYDGRGALASWVRVIALRAAIDLSRRRPAAAGGEDHAGEVPAASDPEREYEQEHYRSAFDEALRGALAALESEQRRILRRHFADGRTLDELAEELGVHRATVARRLALARTTLRSEVRRRLRDALRVDDAELSSVVRFVRSRLDLSLPQLLRTK